MAGSQDLVLAQLAVGGPNYRYKLGQTVIALNGGNKSTVYKALEKLEEVGCVTAAEDERDWPRGEAPPLMFSITPAGRARLRTWMRSELPIDVKPHAELRQRLLFASPEDLPVLLDVVKDAQRRCVQSLADAQTPAPVRESAIAKAADLLAERGDADFAQTTLDWLRSAVVTLERLIREETPPP